MHVIGTSGHVDHGKSTLVEALTGMHPDRLKEEKAREMTIELGFAWFQLPNGEEVGIVDVPGHRDFIENMLSGVGGIDAALLVIAADEGVMPQTREHLAILDLLQIKSGLVVITKTDLVDDPEWLDLVEMDILKVLEGTTFENFPLIRVSSHTGEGIKTLIDELTKVLSTTKNKVDYGRARLPVDRVFTISGFGTVVTGTLLDGVFRVGEEVEILPGQDKARIRGIQTHKSKTDHSTPGSRTAINLSGIELDQIKRGAVVAAVGKYKATNRLDAYIHLLKDSPISLKHNQEVKLFIGANEVLARVRTLAVDEIKQGDDGWIQLELNEPVVAVRTDRLILRRPSPGVTIGGGKIVNPFPGKRHKRFDPLVIKKLEAYTDGTVDDILLEASTELGIGSLDELFKKARINQNEVTDVLQRLIAQGLLFIKDQPDSNFNKNSIFIARDWYQRLTDSALGLIQKYHQQFPLRSGIAREELKSKLKLTQRDFLLMLNKWDVEEKFAITKAYIADKNHKVIFSEEQQKRIQLLFSQFLTDPFSPPGTKECLQVIDLEVFNALLDQGELIAVNNDVVFLRSTYQVMLARVNSFLETEYEITVAQFRDIFQTSRKYALAFLEHLDEEGITTRVGDVRKLRNSKN